MAWRNIDPSLQSALLQTRLDTGIQRQQKFSSDLNILMNVFQQQSAHPFDDSLDKKIFEALSRACDRFRQGAHWDKAEAKDSDYFYRIETLSSFLNRNSRFLYRSWNDDGLVLGSEITEGDTFTVICDDYLEQRQTWLPLTHISSSYFCHRNFSWWTDDYEFDEGGCAPKFFDGYDLNEEASWLIHFAGFVGMVHDWLSPHMLFMRLRKKDFPTDHIRVPSIIDALLQPIFSPQRDPLSARWGLAFDLNETYRPSRREYVLRDVPVSGIEYFPVRLNEKSFEKVNPNGRLNETLIKSLISNI